MKREMFAAALGFLVGLAMNILLRSESFEEGSSLLATNSPNQSDIRLLTDSGNRSRKGDVRCFLTKEQFEKMIAEWDTHGWVGGRSSGAYVSKSLLSGVGVSPEYSKKISEMSSDMRSAFQSLDLKYARVSRGENGSVILTIPAYESEGQELLNNLNDSLTSLIGQSAAELLFPILKHGLEKTTTNFGQVEKVFVMTPNNNDRVEVRIIVGGVGMGTVDATEEMPFQWNHLARFESRSATVK